MNEKINEFFASRRIRALKDRDFDLETALRGIQDDLIAYLGKGGRPKKARKVKGKPGRKKVKKTAGKKKAGAKVRSRNTPALILKILGSQNEPIGPAEILAGLKKKGWKSASKDSQNVIANTLSLMKKRGLIANPAKGKYLIAPKA